MTRVIINSLPDYNFAQLLTAPGVSLVADAPADEGGDDLGPSPYHLLTWALGACTAMTIQVYARRKGYPLHEVAVDIDYDRTHTQDCKDCAGGKSPALEVMHRRIVLHGDLTDEQRDDLLRIARRCPVHRTLEAKPEVIDSVEVV